MLPPCSTVCFFTVSHGGSISADGGLQLVKEPCRWRGFSAIIEEKGELRMENWRKNSRKDIVMVEVDALVPKDHLLRR